MGISFRRSYKLGKNSRINVSENGGVGFSTGFKGFRISRNKNGTRITIGQDGVLYTKFLGKKKKKKKDKNREVNELENNEVVEEEFEIDPETDFEKIPTEDERILYSMIGDKERYYILYGLLITLLGISIYTIFNQELLFYILTGLVGVSLLLYMFLSNLFKLRFNINRAIRLFNKDKYEKAYHVLKTCLKINPTHPKALLLMVFSAYKLEKYDETLSCINAYQKENESIEVIHFIEGVCCSMTGHYNEGILAIEKVYSTDEEVRNSKYKILGDCYFGLKNYDRAINWYNKLPVRKKEMNDELVVYKYALGRACLFDGNKKRSFNYLSQVYDYRADYKDVKQLLEQLY